jgi:serine protease
MKITSKLIFILSSLTALAVFFVSEGATTPNETQRVFVEFQPGRAEAVRSALHNAQGVVHYEFLDLNAFAVTLPRSAIQGLERNPNVVSIEEDASRYPASITSPSFDRLLNQTSGQVTPYGIDMVQAPQLWGMDLSGSGLTVCVIDSGLYTGHEDFSGVNILGGYPTQTWNTDFCGHGTHVAGTIAAAFNDKGVVGVAPGVSLYIVKVFGDNCSWSYSSDLVDAANRCDAAGADVINMSLGGGFRSRVEERAFNNLYNKGILPVAAAGNAGNTSHSYPASYPSVVSVAAIDENKVVADFSQKNNQVELSAPGVGVLSTVPWLAETYVRVDGVDYSAYHMEFAAYGSATGSLVNGGLCTSIGSWSGRVVLCERGQISFYDKVRNVQNSGGAAAVIYNNEPGNFFGTLGAGNSSTIPAVTLSQADGQYLVANKLGQNATATSSSSIPDSGYEAWNGTSTATPHVAGAAALVWSANPAWTNVEIREALQQSAEDLGAAGRDNAYGYGLVKAYEAWVALGGGGSEPPPPPPPPGGQLSVSVVTDKAVYQNRETVTITATVTRDGNPVDGATANMVITSPNGKTITGSGTTNANGQAVFTWRANVNSHGRGEYSVVVNAAKNGLEPGEGSTTFRVE